MNAFYIAIGAMTLLFAIAVALAQHRAWFSLTGRRGGILDHKLKAGVIVDPDKAKHDLQKVKNAVAELRD